jgi:bifunctional non-homologous end joining protein LigD
MQWPIAPMKAVTAEVVPIGDVWMYEPKWDGHRVLVRRIGDDFDAVSSTGKPKLPQWRWLATAVAAATDHDVVLDGEVIAYGADGRHTFQSVGNAEREHAFVVFDLLALDGADLRERPWSERRSLLEASVRPVPPLSITPVSDDADVMGEALQAQRFEGIMAKRAASTYQSGRRAPAWVKVKYRRQQEMVVGGYKLGEGNRAGWFGSLLVGVHDRVGGDLRFVGAVGTGFNERTLKSVMAELRRLETAESPFAVPPKLPRGTYRWVRPELVVQVEFLEWTEGGGIRAPVYLGVRDDKPPREVIREEGGSS